MKSEGGFRKKKCVGGGVGLKQVYNISNLNGFLVFFVYKFVVDCDLGQPQHNQHG